MPSSQYLAVNRHLFAALMDRAPDKNPTRPLPKNRTAVICYCKDKAPIAKKLEEKWIVTVVSEQGTYPVSPVQSSKEAAEKILDMLHDYEDDEDED